MKYKVKVIETIENVVEIEATSENEACEMTETMWCDCEVILSNQSKDVYVIND